MRRLMTLRLTSDREAHLRAQNRPETASPGSGRLPSPLRGSSGDGLARFCRDKREAGNSICMSLGGTYWSAGEAASYRPLEKRVKQI